MPISQYYFYSEVRLPPTLFIYQKLQMSAVSSFLFCSNMAASTTEGFFRFTVANG